MNKFMRVLKSAPKRSGALAIVLSAIAIPAGLFAWGPDRPTFTYEKPASYVTFNSITNNPTHGDERNSVQIKEASAPNSTYGENVDLQAGKEYEVYAYYHNNAASNLNDAAHNYKGIARNATMRVQMPATIKAGEKARVTAFVGASNANPGQVWDEAYGTAKGDFALRYVPGSAKIHSNGAVNGKTLPDSLYTTGTPLGYDALDGNLPGCNKFAGYVTFKIHVDQPNFEVNKTVSKSGENKFAEQVSVAPNDEVDYKIQYKNTGTTQQDSVVIKDKLPAGVSYVAGSTLVANSKTGGQYKAIDDNGVTARGINLGSYAPNGNVYVKFKAKITSNDKLAKCGVNTLINTATAETPNGSKSDTANVVVTKECQPPTPPKEIEVCRLSDKKIVKINESDYNTEKYSKNFDDCKEVPTPPKNIEVCRLSDKKIVTIEEKDYNTEKYSKNFNDCKETPAPGKLEVCRLNDKKIVTIMEEDFDTSKYSKDFDDCKDVPVTPETPVTPATPSTPEAPVTPSVPAELPKTGASNSFFAALGLGSVVAAAAYAVTGRRNG